MIIEAILKINPNAKVILRGSDLDTCTIDWLEGTTPISKADIKTKMSTIKTEIAQAETAATNKKTSGKTKLKNLGLDDDEIKALIGV